QEGAGVPGEGAEAEPGAAGGDGDGGVKGGCSMQTKSLKGGVTKEEYFRLAEEGHFRGRRVELIGGEIVEMSPVNIPHAVALTATVHALELAFGPGYWVKSQSTLDLSPNGVPDPDVVVLRGTYRSYLGQSNPTSALLVVEV